MVVIHAGGGEGLVKERFENVVEEIGAAFAPTGNVGVVGAVCKQVADEIFAPAAPRLAALDAEPAFLLQEVEEDNLAEQVSWQSRRNRCRVR